LVALERVCPVLVAHAFRLPCVDEGYAVEGGRVVLGDLLGGDVGHVSLSKVKLLPEKF